MGSGGGATTPPRPHATGSMAALFNVLSMTRILNFVHIPRSRYYLPPSLLAYREGEEYSQKMRKKEQEKLVKRLVEGRNREERTKRKVV